MKSSVKLPLHEFRIQLPEEIVLEETNSTDKFDTPKKPIRLVSKDGVKSTTLCLNSVDPDGIFIFALKRDKRELYFIANPQNFKGSIPHFHKKCSSVAGSIQAFFKSHFNGLGQGYTETLLLEGIGFKVIKHGDNEVEFKLGYSHSIYYVLPQDISCFIKDSTKLCIFGYNKARLAQIAARIKSIRPPEPYKGKGIRRSTDTINLKKMK